jgi:outer membrane protein OmpA-like peptidoglycan-associated protein/tetratricopeptide (TPR) repeat protein
LRRIKKIWLLVFLILVPQVHGQYYSSGSRKAIKRFQEARRCFETGDLNCSEKALRKAIKADDEFIEAYQMLAQICFDQGRTEEAINWYSITLEIDPDGNPEGYRLLAGLVLYTGDYGRSLGLIERYLDFPPAEANKRKEAEVLKQKCIFAMEAMKNPVPFEPVNLGSAVNSEYSEYWPSLSVDEEILMFTVMLPGKAPSGEDALYLHEDFFYSLWSEGSWTPRVNAGAPLNSPGNEGAQSMTADGSTLWFTACNRRDGLGMCDLYFSKLENGKWSVPTNAGSPLNSRFSEKHPAISADGRRLIFTSNRPGGSGSYDLWMSEKHGQEWSLPVNLGDSLNTPGLEQSPFIHPDQQSLYFSSNGWPGMGQGDLYLSRLDHEKHWSKPENLGYPINTQHDEIGLTVNASGNRAYFASDRGERIDTDIYSFEMPERHRPVPVSYMSGRVYDSHNMKGLKAVMQLIDLESGEAVMELESHPGEGSYLISLPTGRDYALNVSADGYLFYSEHFAFRGQYSQSEPQLRDVPLERIDVGSVVILHNVFFATDSSQLEPESRAELNKVRDFLLDNPSIGVEISGHTDNTGSLEHNQDLSEQRAKSVVDYLRELGISEQRMQAEGYGEDQPVEENDSEEGRARNRRTELKIIRIHE